MVQNVIQFFVTKMFLFDRLTLVNIEYRYRLKSLNIFKFSEWWTRIWLRTIKPAGLAYRYRLIWYISRYSQYRQSRYIGISSSTRADILSNMAYRWRLTYRLISAKISVNYSKAWISADSIDRYIGSVLPISVIAISVKSHRYANPE